MCIKWRFSSFHYWKSLRHRWSTSIWSTNGKCSHPLDLLFDLCEQFHFFSYVHLEEGEGSSGLNLLLFITSHVLKPVGVLNSVGLYPTNSQQMVVVFLYFLLLYFCDFLFKFTSYFPMSISWFLIRIIRGAGVHRSGHRARGRETHCPSQGTHTRTHGHTFIPTDAVYNLWTAGANWGTNADQVKLQYYSTAGTAAPQYCLRT